MQENLLLKGQWFLPTSPETRVNGILTYNHKDGAELELFGSLKAGINVPIINGVTSDSREITLYHVFYHHRGGEKLISNREVGIPTVTYTVNYILDGHHYKNVEDLKFKKLNARIHNLDEWLGVSGFHPPIDNIMGQNYSVDYLLPNPIPFKIDEQLSGTFKFVVNNPTIPIHWKEIEIKQNVELIIECTDDLSFKEWQERLFTFANFITLSLFEPAYPTSLILKNSTEEEGVPNDIEVKVYFPVKGARPVSQVKDWPEMLYYYQMIKDNFDDIIFRWYELRQSLAPVHNLLFEQFYSDGAFNENWFLNLAQAAETLHARLNKKRGKMPETEYKKLKEEIRAAVPQKYLDWLNSEVFPFGNSLTLDTRLNELIDKYNNPILEEVIGDKAEFIESVKQSRNYYTHYSQAKDKSALKVMDLFHLSQRIKPLIIAVYLEETGFTHEQVASIMQQHKNYFRPFRQQHKILNTESSNLL